MRDAQVDFSAGQLSPRTSGRVDLPFHRAGALEMTDFIALPQGPAEARPGTIRIDDLDEPDKIHRLIPMAVDQTNTIILVINDSRIYAYKLLQDGSNVSAVPLLDALDDKLFVEISYFEGDLFDLQFTPFDGKMYIAHPAYTLKVVSFDAVHVLLSIENFAARYRKYVEADVGGYKAGDTYYHNGVIYRALIDSPDAIPAVIGDGTIYYIAESSEQVPTLVGYTTAIPQWTAEAALGDTVVHNGIVWVLGTKESQGKDEPDRLWYYGTAYSPAVVPQDDDGTYLWGSCDERLLESNTDVRPPDYPAEPSGLGWLRVLDLPGSPLTLPYFDETGGVYAIGDVFYFEASLYKCTTATGAAPPPSPNAQTIGDWVRVTDAPTFSSDGHYPNLIVFHDRRMYVLGTTNKPGMIYASKTGIVDEFTMSLRDDGGFQIELNTEVSELATWARSRSDLVVGSSKSEWIISGGDGPITPSSVFAFPQSKAGAMRDGAIDISDMLVFFQKGGNRLLRFVFSNDTQSYITPDMTQMSQDIFLPGVKEFALQSNPDFILWCVMNDGTLVGGTYNPLTQSFGWHQHETEGLFESIAVTSNDIGEDEVWFLVSRETPTGTERQLERFAFREQADKGADMIYLDDAEVVAVNDGKAVVSDDKFDTTLSVLYGGAAHPDVTADGEGNIEFQHKLFDKAVVGRPYYPKLRPQRLDPGGSTLDAGVRISRAAIRVYKTLGVQVGADEDHLNPIQFRSTSGIMGEAPPLFTGEKPISVDHSFGDESWLLIMRDQPFPCMVLGVTYELQAGAI